MRVVFYDTADKLALGNARRCVSLDELLEVSDVVSLHVDGRPSNSSLFGEKEFSRMRPGALFLNLCRGFVIDHEALRRHLLSGHLAGAAVDVFPEEPRAAGEEFVSVLRGLPNVILTPHIGGSTEEAQADIGAFVGAKLADFVAEGSTSLSVNLPQVALPPATGTHRLAHIHQQCARCHGGDQLGAGRARRQRRGPAARHPRRPRLRADRHRRSTIPRRSSSSCAR